MPQILDDGRTDGTTLGNIAAAAVNGTVPKLNFFGVLSPIAQPAVGTVQAIGTTAGAAITFASTQSPTSVATLTTAELGMTLVGGTGAAVTIASGDLLYINKPTAQANLGVGNIRVSSAGVAGVTFSNISAGPLTPTASEVYSVVALRSMGNLTAVLTPAAVAGDTVVEQTFTVTGLRASTLVQVNKPTSQPGLDIVGVRVASANTLGITFMNTTASTTITPTAGESYTVLSLAGLNSSDNEIIYQMTGGTLASVAASTSAQQNVTITNLLASDVVRGVSKPTTQAGLGIAGYRVSSAGFVGITFGNFTTAAITPTGNEVYEVDTYRSNPSAPMVLYSAALAPVSVAANTMAEQTFTVTGLIASTPVWVNKPSAQAGLGIAGVRVSALNTLAINYVNTSSAAIVPTAETYLVGNFQLLIETTGSSTIQAATASGGGQSLNAIRTALINLGLVTA